MQKVYFDKDSYHQLLLPLIEIEKIFSIALDFAETLILSESCFNY